MGTVQERLASLKAAKEVEVLEFAGIMESNVLELKASEDHGFDMGLAQAGVPATDKIYTEADLQAEKKFLQDQIDALALKVAGFEGALVDAKAAGALEMKLDIVAKMESTLIDNNALLAELKA